MAPSPHQRNTQPRGVTRVDYDASTNTRAAIAPVAPASTAGFTADQERLHRALSDIADRLDDKAKR